MFGEAGKQSDDHCIWNFISYVFLLVYSMSSIKTITIAKSVKPQSTREFWLIEKGSVVLPTYPQNGSKDVFWY